MYRVVIPSWSTYALMKVSHRPSRQLFVSTWSPSDIRSALAPASWDLAQDRPLDPDPVHPGEDALLLVEGVYLRRPQLVGEWDATCLVTASASRSSESMPAHTTRAVSVESEKNRRDELHRHKAGGVSTLPGP